MRKQVFSLALAAVVGLSAVAGARAQTPAAPPTTRVGIINIQRAIAESIEGKKAGEKLQEEFAPKFQELQGKQAETERLQKQLREQERALSDEARANLVRQIETKTKDFNRSSEDLDADFQQAQRQMVNEIGRKMIKVLDEYATKNGYHVVIDVGTSQSPVLWASTTVDMTDEIIKLYNAGGTGSASSPSAPTSAPAATRGTPAAKPPVATKPPAASKPPAPR